MTDAAEAHGTLAGCLCATIAYRFEDWLLEILPEGRADPYTTETLRGIFRTTADSLGETQMEFSPLLPEDEQPIDALQRPWACGVTDFYTDSGRALNDASQLPGEVGEIVRDLTEITRVGVDAADSMESNEGAYAELVEFVRVGVQLVFDELEPLREPAPRVAGSLH